MENLKKKNKCWQIWGAGNYPEMQRWSRRRDRTAYINESQLCPQSRLQSAAPSPLPLPQTPKMGPASEIIITFLKCFLNQFLSVREPEREREGERLRPREREKEEEYDDYGARRVMDCWHISRANSTTSINSSTGWNEMNIDWDPSRVHFQLLMITNDRCATSSINRLSTFD